MLGYYTVVLIVGIFGLAMATFFGYQFGYKTVLDGLKYTRDNRPIQGLIFVCTGSAFAFGMAVFALMFIGGIIATGQSIIGEIVTMIYNLMLEKLQ